ncbi:MAG: hypothetical protein WAN04_13745 [Candidatus Udaeobacter sp.]
MNRADGISEIEGKAAVGSGERVGKGASFKSVVVLIRLATGYSNAFGDVKKMRALVDEGKS